MTRPTLPRTGNAPTGRADEEDTVRAPRTTAVLLALVTAVALSGCSEGNVFELAVGDCFDDTAELGGGEVSDVPVVPCDEPHDNEVFHTFEVPDGEFPGEEALVALAEETCVPAFEEWVGIEYASSSLDMFPITPTESSWSTGDREVVCALYDLEQEQLEGSMQDAAR